MHHRIVGNRAGRDLCGLINPPPPQTAPQMLLLIQSNGFHMRGNPSGSLENTCSSVVKERAS